MSDMGQMLRRAMMANQGRPMSPMMLNGSPIGRPDALPGQFPGLLDTISPEKPQSGPQGGAGGYDGDSDPSGADPSTGLLWGTKRPPVRSPPSGMLGVIGGPNPPPQTPMDLIKAGAGAIPPALNRLNTWANQTPYLMGTQGAPIESAIDQHPPDVPDAQMLPVAQTSQALRPARLPFPPRSVPVTSQGPISAGANPPGIGTFAPQQSAAALPSPRSPQPQQPPPQGPGQPPPTTQGIPLTSAAGRMGQETGSALDRYFQMMMGLQRQRMLMQMAGGLLGAPTLAEGAGRAFRGGAEALGGQAGPMNNIMGAQAAGQLAGAHPGWNEKDRQAAILGGLFGGQNFIEKLAHPDFGKYEGGSGQFEITPSGRHVDTGSGLSVWAHSMGFQDKNGNPTKDYTQADRKPSPDGSGRILYRMGDGTYRDPTHDNAEQQ